MSHGLSTAHRLLALGALGEQSLTAYLLGLGPLALWDARSRVYSDAGSTPVADGGSVQQWNDLSTNGYHVSQSTASAKPTWHASLAGLNNRPYLAFDGGDYLTRAVAGIAANLNTYNICVVYTTTTTTTLTAYGEGNSGTDVPLIEVDKHTSNGVRHLHRSDASVLSNVSASGLSSDNGNAHIITARRIGAASWNLRLDGVQAATGTTSIGATTVDTIAIGALSRSTVTNHFVGNIAHVSVYGTDIYSAVEPAIASWYGISL